MDKLLLQNGQPIPFSDLDFMQEGIRDAFKAILSAYGFAEDESFIISGVEFTITDLGGGDFQYDYTDGYISLNGEVLKVVAGSITVPSGETPYWTLQSTFVDPAPLVLADLTTADVLQQRRAVPANSATPPNPFMPLQANKLIDIAVNGRDTWHIVGDAGEPAFGNTWSAAAGSDVRFKKSGNRVDIILNAVKADNAQTNAIVFTLPEGYRPTVQLYQPAYGLGGGESIEHVIQINTAGEVSITNGNAGTFTYANFFLQLSFVIV